MHTIAMTTISDNSRSLQIGRWTHSESAGIRVLTIANSSGRDVRHGSVVPFERLCMFLDLYLVSFSLGALRPLPEFRPQHSCFLCREMCLCARIKLAPGYATEHRTYTYHDNMVRTCSVAPA